jgi:hypothetical protein
MIQAIRSAIVFNCGIVTKDERVQMPVMLDGVPGVILTQSPHLYFGTVEVIMGP